MNLFKLSEMINNKQSREQFMQQNGIIHNNRYCSQSHTMVLSLRCFWYLLDNKSITDRQDRWRCRQGSCHEDIPVRK